jgi:hypothetical protein
VGHYIAAGTNTTAAAWKLVACDMGVDCSQGSALLRQSCLNGGIYCGPGDLRTNMMNSEFSPENFAKVQQLEVLIYDALKSGNESTLFSSN